MNIDKLRQELNDAVACTPAEIEDIILVVQPIIEQLEAEQKRSFTLLNCYGVPKSRANTIPKGIGVLATRYDKEIYMLRQIIVKLEADKAELVEALKDIKNTTCHLCRNISISLCTLSECKTMCKYNQLIQKMEVK